MCERERKIEIEVPKYYSTTKKEILPFVTTSVKLEGAILSEINQTEKVKNRMISLLCET